MQRKAKRAKRAKLGSPRPDRSAIDFSIKFGALPMYVVAPITTLPALTAASLSGVTPATRSGCPWLRPAASAEKAA
jgi:hypothetical protein